MTKVYTLIVMHYDRCNIHVSKDPLELHDIFEKEKAQYFAEGGENLDWTKFDYTLLVDGKPCEDLTFNLSIEIQTYGDIEQEIFPECFID